MLRYYIDVPIPILFDITEYNLSSNVREALLKGLAPDGGLYFPAVIPLLDHKELESLPDLSYPDLAAMIIDKFSGSDILPYDISEIRNETEKSHNHTQQQGVFYANNQQTCRIEKAKDQYHHRNTKHVPGNNHGYFAQS